MALERTPLQSKAAPERRPVLAALQQRAAGSAVPKPPPQTAARTLQQRLGNQRTQQLLAERQGASAGRSPRGAGAAAGGKSPPPARSGKMPATAGRRAPEKQAPAQPSAERATEHASDGPSAHEAIATAAAAVRHRAAAARKHAATSVRVAAAQAAAIVPAAEQKRSAAVLTVEHIDSAQTAPVQQKTFKDSLIAAIEAATPTPKTEDEADTLIKDGAQKASNTLRSQLTTERDAAAGPMKSAADAEVSPASQPAPPAAQMQSEAVGAAPAPVSAASVVPEPLPAQKLDYSSDRAPTEKLMADQGVTQEQMQESNDPAFAPSMSARSAAEAHEAAAPAQYRQGEAKFQDAAHSRAAQVLATDLAGMHGQRQKQLAKVAEHQVATKTKDSQERQRITDTINGIKDKTRTDVADILKSMEDEATKIFEAGLARAERAYADTFDDAKGGFGTWLTTWGDDWRKLIESSLGKARDEYMRQVKIAIGEVADLVDGKIKAAKQRVSDGLKEVKNFVDGLDASVKHFGEEAIEAVSGEFDTMTGEIDQRRDGLIEKLTTQYKSSRERMSAMEEKLREANKSLWDRVYDATVGLVKQIIAFKDMLIRVLARAAAVVGDIILHPIRFLGNLIAAVMQGLKGFISKIGTYLMEGLTAWIFGALGGAGLQLPKTLDLQGIMGLVLQILGLTYANFRARAVAIVGEPTVAAIEKTAEVFKILLTEGVSGLWRLIAEQLANLKSMVLDAIFDFIKEKVIIAGITWIIGLLNPASAFFKACKAIYDIITFFVTRGSQILSLVNAILDSVSAIASGAIGAAANFVEGALAKAIPVAIGFLASLLGLGDPAKPVRTLIEKAQAPVNKAIDWVINLAVRGVKALGKFLGVGKSDQKPDQRTDAEKRQDLHSAVAEAEQLMEMPEATAESVRKELPRLEHKYRLKSIALVKDSEEGSEETDHVVAEINPKKEGKKEKLKRGDESAEEKGFEAMWRKDKRGNTVHVQATLKEVVKKAKRSAGEVAAQSETAARGKAGDVGGHLIGHRFVLDQGSRNMFPQNATFNNSAWKKMENEWAAAIQQGHQVTVIITLRAASGDRPSRIEVVYEYFHVESKRITYNNFVEFENDKSQKFDRLSKDDIGILIGI